MPAGAGPSAIWRWEATRTANGSFSVGRVGGQQHFGGPAALGLARSTVAHVVTPHLFVTSLAA